MRRRILVTVCLTGLLTTCQYPPREGSSAPAPDGVDVAGSENEFSITVISEAEVLTGDHSGFMDEQQFLADILFEGLQALDADRLLSPVDDNAHARFQRVLAYDPDNEIALQGLQDIASRYLELSLQSSRRGLFGEAATMLENARFVDADHPDIASTWITLQAEINSGDLFFDLDNNAVTRRSESAQVQLANIARQARDLSANFLITAPNDDNARWMFNTMREAVDGYRLRGNIELASRTTVRLRVPRN